MKNSLDNDQVDRPTSVTRADRFRSWLLAANVLAVGAVLLLVMIWIAGWEPSTIKDVTGATGIKDKSNEESLTTSDEGEFDEPEVDSALSDDESITPTSLDGFESLVKANQSELAEIGRRKGNDGREIGPAPPGDNTEVPDYVPEWERWRVMYFYEDFQSYTLQLDYLAIEIGAVDAETPRVDYLLNVGETKPAHRVGIRSDEDRINFRSLDRKIQQWDLDLFNAAGVKTKGTIIVHFYPESLRAKLLKLESEMLEGRGLSDVKRTTFRVNPEGDSFAISVENVQFFSE